MYWITASAVGILCIAMIWAVAILLLDIQREWKRRNK
tara:strand:- start:1288 stop:1398 length:111 start_codon:yes stop_codon:yes gene_type:complete